MRLGAATGVTPSTATPGYPRLRLDDAKPALTPTLTRIHTRPRRLAGSAVRLGFGLANAPRGSAYTGVARVVKGGTVLQGALADTANALVARGAFLAVVASFGGRLVGVGTDSCS